MIIGQCFIPIPFVGSFVGLLVGTLVGHIFGKGISQSCSSYLASAVDKLTGGNAAGAGTKVD
jgi:H+/Cl- antiporter ClcA